MLPLVNYTNEICGLFLHHRLQKLGRFLVIFAVWPIHFCMGESLCSLQLFCASFKSTAILFPLIIYANEMCGLFLCSKLGNFAVCTHFAIGRICFCYICSVHHTFVKVHCLPFYFLGKLSYSTVVLYIGIMEDRDFLP